MLISLKYRLFLLSSVMVRKAGLAPMHTWLPDAHSQAPSPVSGLLSGALLSCALYVIMRNLAIIKGTAVFPFVQQLLLALGIFLFL